MSTRCLIGYLREDDKIESIYCHHDGYPEYVGRILKENYKDIKTIKRLMSLGDLSSLGKIPESKSELWSHELSMDDYEIMSEHFCKSYKDRDSTMYLNQPNIHENERDYIRDMKNCNGEYAYLFKDNKWIELVNKKEI